MKWWFEPATKLCIPGLSFVMRWAVECGLHGRLGAPVIAYISTLWKFMALGFHGNQLSCLLQNDLDCIDAVIGNTRCSFETVRSQHKQLHPSSQKLLTWICILSSMITQITMDPNFNHFYAREWFGMSKLDGQPAVGLYDERTDNVLDCGGKALFPHFCVIKFNWIGIHWQGLYPKI